MSGVQQLFSLDFFMRSYGFSFKMVGFLIKLVLIFHKSQGKGTEFMI